MAYSISPLQIQDYLATQQWLAWISGWHEKHIRLCIYNWVWYILMVIKKIRYRGTIISKSRVRSSSKYSMSSYMAQKNIWRYGRVPNKSYWNTLWQQVYYSNGEESSVPQQDKAYRHQASLQQRKKLSSSTAWQISKSQTCWLRHFKDQNSNCYETYSE